MEAQAAAVAGNQEAVVDMAVVDMAVADMEAVVTVVAPAGPVEDQDSEETVDGPAAVDQDTEMAVVDGPAADPAPAAGGNMSIDQPFNSTSFGYQKRDM